MVPTFLPGDMVAVRRMMKDGDVPLGKEHVIDGDLECAWVRLRGDYWISVEAKLQTKLVNCDEFSDHRFEDIIRGERPSDGEKDLVEEETVLESSSGPPETHPTGGRRVTGKTKIVIDDPD